MEINRSNLRLANVSLEFISTDVKQEIQESESSDLEVIAEANNFCAIEIKEENSLIRELGTNVEDDLECLSITLNSLGNVIAQSLHHNLSETNTIDDEIRRRMSQATEVFINDDQGVQNEAYDVSIVDIASEYVGELNGKVVTQDRNQRLQNIHAFEWLRDVTDETNNAGLDSDVCRSDKRGIDISGDFESTVTTVSKRKGRTRAPHDRYRGLEVKVNYSGEKTKRRAKRKAKPRQDYRERLRKKAECMREKRRKLYEEETEADRLQRLAKEAAKRREIRMYYETPEQRRKRLDAEAARKREYRMYNETPDERRKRLDREAERRRIKRLTLYANETAEQRRERLNRESAKRREARLNQYSKETEDQRRERLRKDALRAREMRFTRSAIETEEERRQRLVKDALRKRELRMHGENSTSNFTELQTVRSFEELNNVQMRDDPDNQLGSHYLSNWMMWFQNTLTQPVHIGDQTIEPQSQNNG